MFLCVAICSLVFVNLPGLIVDAKSAPQTFAELQEYFEKEIQRIENKHEVEIQTLKREIHQERHERIRETAVMKARHEGALTEINKLKGQLAGNGRIIEKMYVHDTKLKEEEARYESVEEFIDDPKGLTIEKGRELTDAPGDEEDHGIKDAVENKRTIDTDTNKGKTRT